MLTLAGVALFKRAAVVHPAGTRWHLADLLLAVEELAPVERFARRLAGPETLRRR